MFTKHPQHVNHVQMDTFTTSLNSGNFFLINIYSSCSALTEFNTWKTEGKKIPRSPTYCKNRTK